MATSTVIGRRERWSQAAERYQDISLAALVIGNWSSCRIAAAHHRRSRRRDLFVAPPMVKMEREVLEAPGFRAGPNSRACIPGAQPRTSRSGNYFATFVIEGL